MKNLTLAIFLFLVIGCKKEEETYTSVLLIPQKTYVMSDTSATFRGSIFAPPNGSVNLKDHGFRIMKYNPNPRMATGFKVNAGGVTSFYDTTIQLGPKKIIGNIEHVLVNLTPATKYHYYVYVVDQDDRFMAGRSDSIITTGMAP